MLVGDPVADQDLRRPFRKMREKSFWKPLQGAFHQGEVGEAGQGVWHGTGQGCGALHPMVWTQVWVQKEMGMDVVILG